MTFQDFYHGVPGTLTTEFGKFITYVPTYVHYMCSLHTATLTFEDLYHSVPGALKYLEFGKCLYRKSNKRSKSNKRTHFSNTRLLTFENFYHGVPHLGHPWARCIDDSHLFLLQELHLRQRGPKRGQDHDVALLDVAPVS